MRAAARYRANPERHRKSVKESRERHLAKSLLRGVQKRAKAKGLEFDLWAHVVEIKARIDAGTCEATGLPFQIGNGHHWASPSIHRKSPSRGYVYDNIEIVVHGFNNALGNWGIGVLLQMVDGHRARR